MMEVFLLFFSSRSSDTSGDGVIWSSFGERLAAGDDQREE
jgi:hypothetical protein